MKKLILIDGHALVHRAFHALPPSLTAPSGIPTNAVYGFTSVLLKIIKDLNPDYVVATFDLAAPTFRHEEFAEYKVHRQKGPDELYAQVPFIKDILEAFGIPIFEQEGFEADDLIGTIAKQAKENPPDGGLQVIIATGDLDTLQLVDDDRVVVLTLKKGVSETVLYTEDAVNERYGLKPSQLTDFKGLKGDPSDNIPGVPGIGDKTASSLMQAHNTLENLYTALEKGKAKDVSEKLAAKLIENKDQAFFSKRLATIICDVPLLFSIEQAEWRQHMDARRLTALIKDLGFYSLVKRFHELTGETSVVTTPAAKTEASPVTKVRHIARIPAMKEAIIFPVMREGSMTDIAVLGPRKEALAIDPADVRTTLEQLASVETLIGHDLKPLIRTALEQGVLFQNKLQDTKIAAWLLSPDQKNYELEKTYYQEFQQPLPADPHLYPAAIYALRERLWESLKSSKLLKVFEDIEMPLIPVLAKMEQAGIAVDIKILSKLAAVTARELKKLEGRIYKLAKIEFNINSPRQLGEVLFERLGISGKVRKTSSGARSTAAPELEKIREAHPIIDLILDYRELQKLQTTYIEPFPSFVNGKGKRLHTTYNQTGTGTGRLSSQDPNLQNIPTRTEVGKEFRKAFIAPKGKRLVCFDYSQLELRIAAHIAKDQQMLEAFRRGEDIHTRTAAEVFNVAPEQVTKAMRRQAKVLNFGIIYGMGILGFARAAGVDRARAREFIDQYLREFKGVAKYMEDVKQQAADKEYVETLFGRRRLLPDIQSAMPQLRAQAERMAINHPIQGTEADFIKIAMINIDKYIEKEFPDGQIKMLLQVHDELVFEMDENLVQKTAPSIKKIMEDVYELAVPLVVDVSWGKNWAVLERLAISYD